MSEPLRDLLLYLRDSRGFDFTAYKPSTLERRVQKRMKDLGVEGYETYSDYLEVHPDELAKLFNTVLINVTSFFRDRPAWEVLAAEIVPRLLAEKGTETLRIWSAGCASGEEPYSLLMTLCEAVGEEEFRRRVKIYATDLDEEALAEARAGSYSEAATQAVPPDLLERYFERSGERYLFRQDLRRALVFGRHDLLVDAPISRIGLLACRNTLMYFNAEAQRRVGSRLHFALNPNGFLFLGKAEMLFSQADSFTPVDLKRRIFSKAGEALPRERLSAAAPRARGARRR